MLDVTPNGDGDCCVEEVVLPNMDGVVVDGAFPPNGEEAAVTPPILPSNGPDGTALVVAPPKVVGLLVAGDIPNGLEEFDPVEVVEVVVVVNGLGDGFATVVELLLPNGLFTSRLEDEVVVAPNGFEVCCCVMSCACCCPLPFSPPPISPPKERVSIFRWEVADAPTYNSGIALDGNSL